MKRFIFSILSLLTCFLASSQPITPHTYFVTFPTVSPDGETTLFTYDADIWSVSTVGGQASRITALDGKESRVKCSPDGKWLAFSSDKYGNDDIFIMPTGGGEVTRLTYHEGFDHVDSWSWDSETIYFTSDRYNIHSGYKVSIKGGTPQRVFDDHYFNNSHNLTEHPQSGEIFFNESWESKRYEHRLGYKGPYNPEIKSFNLKTKEYKEYTDWEGKDFWLTIDKEGNQYFVSDQGNGVNNLCRLEGDSVVFLTSLDTPIKRPQVSVDGSVIVFESDYQVYTYSPDQKTLTKVSVVLNSFDGLSDLKEMNTDDHISYFDLSGDGNKMAFVSRGELFISDVSGEFVRQIETKSGGRVREVMWMSDNKTLFYNQTVNGVLNFFTITLDGKETQLTFDKKDNRKFRYDSKRENVVYFSGNSELKEYNFSKNEAKLLVEDEFWGFYNTIPNYSPDDQRIVYSAIRDFEREVFIYEKSAGKVYNMTRTGVSEFTPIFDPSGKSIYYMSNRFKPGYPRGLPEYHVYELPLAKFSKPFKSDRLNQLFEDNSEENKESFDIDTTRLVDRVNLVSSRLGIQYGAIPLKTHNGTMILYGSNHNKGTYQLCATVKEPFKENQFKYFDGTNYMGRFSVRSHDGAHYILFNGNIHTLSLSGYYVTKINVNQSFTISRRDELADSFDEAWNNLMENYYDTSLSDSASNAIYQKFKKVVPQITSQDDLSVLINDMFGVLNASHLGYTPEDDEKDDTYETSCTGLVFAKDNPYEVERVVSNSPTDYVEIDLQQGDVLTRVNGIKVNAENNREMYFAGTSLSEELSMTFDRNGKSFKIKVHSETHEDFVSHLYDEWQDNNEAYVTDKGSNRISYVHMKDMGSESLDNFMYKMVSDDGQKGALILDVRYNRGGNVHNDVIQFLSQKQYFQWKYKNGKMTSQPNFIPGSKPIVLLINEQTLSDGEVTADGFKRLNLGTVVGMPTYRWIIFTTSDTLLDGAEYRLPSWGCYTMDGDDLEKTGVEPDVRVEQNFDDRMGDKETQLDKAIEILLDQLKP